MTLWPYWILLPSGTFFLLPAHHFRVTFTSQMESTCYELSEYILCIKIYFVILFRIPDVKLLSFITAMMLFHCFLTSNILSWKFTCNLTIVCLKSVSVCFLFPTLNLFFSSLILLSSPWVLFYLQLILILGCKLERWFCVFSHLCF